MTDGTTDGPTIRMTYAELATARGISLDAARRLVLRKRWSKQIGNDGLTRALVPTEYAEPSGRDIGTDNGGDDGTDTAVILADASLSTLAQATAALVLDGMSDVQTVVPSLRDAIAALSIQLSAAEERADQERQRADQAESRAQEAAERARALAEQLTAEQQCRAENQDRGNRAESQAKESEQRVQAAEGRIRDLQEQLTAEMVEHRRVVGMLTEQLATRRSWWPWRRRA